MTVEVTQADRDAAAKHYREGELIQAFAAHRIASLEGVAGLVEAAKQMRVRLRHDDNCPALTDSSCEYSSCECGIAEIALNFDAALATFRDQGGR